MLSLTLTLCYRGADPSRSHMLTVHKHRHPQVSEKERLVELAEALRSKMAYFDELERVAVQFHGASLDVDSDRFLPLLQRLDDCISCAPKKSAS